MSTSSAMPMMEQQATTAMNWTYDDDYSISFSTASEAEEDAVVLQALRSDRLLYDEPADEDDASSCCMLISKDSSNDDTASAGSMVTKATAATEAATATVVAPAFGGATAMSVESQNPYRDFRESMEAMVMSQLVGVGEAAAGKKDWHWLEEMLGWYLRANAKSTHGVIVGAFVDLLVALTTTSPPPPPPPAAAAAADNYYSSSSSASSPPDTPDAAAGATNCCSAASSSDCSCCSSSSLL